MKSFECIIIVLVLLITWKCCLCKDSENFGTAPQPYTPKIAPPAWMALSPFLSFEDSQNNSRSQTLLRRLGMDNAGSSAPKENFQTLMRTNASNSFDQQFGYGGAI